MKRQFQKEILTTSTTTLTTIIKERKIKERKITKNNSSLPNQDFIEIILKYLSPEDLYYTIPFICNYWNNSLQKMENSLWKVHLNNLLQNNLKNNLLKNIKEDKYTNYKKLYLTLIGGKLYFKELFIFKLNKLTNQLNNLQLNSCDSDCDNIYNNFYNKNNKLLEKMKLLIEQEKEILNKNNKFLNLFLEIDNTRDNNDNYNCDNYFYKKDYNNNLLISEKEKQLNFLQSHILVNLKNSEITEIEIDEKKSMTSVNFCNEITIIGINGNCSNQFIYEGNLEFDNFYENPLDISVTLIYNNDNYNNDYNKDYNNLKKELYIYSKNEKEEKDERILNCKRIRKLFKKLKRKLGYTELTFLEILNVFNDKLHCKEILYFKNYIFNIDLLQ
ncbi:hypothetical protein ABK040_016689 [Willaertia magna]